MKFEIKRSEQGVEIHLFNEDGSITVWLCDSEQAAVFKLTSLIFSRAENPEQAKRSILVGDFDPVDTQKREKPLSERAAEVGRRLVGAGASEKWKAGQNPHSTQEEQSEMFKELLEQLKKGTMIQPIGGSPNYPGVFPGTVPSYPFGYGKTYIGDPIGFPGSSIIVDVCGGVAGVNGSVVPSGLQANDIYCSMGSTKGEIIDTEVGNFLIQNNCHVNVFKTSMKAAG